MEINKNKLQGLLDEWLVYREEELYEVTGEDKEYIEYGKIDSIHDDILNYIEEEDRNAVYSKLENLTDCIFNHSDYFNKKYYKAGFSDGIKLILSVLI